MRSQALPTRIGQHALLAVAAVIAGCATTTASTDIGGADDASATTDATSGGDPSTGDPADAGISPLPGNDAAGDPAAEVALPFHVSDEFIASGFMGDSQAARDGIQLSSAATDCLTPRAPGAGGDCYRVGWTVNVAAGAATWAGVYWQSPANNWGAKPGKRIAAGATKVSFYAAGAAGGEKIQFCAGGVNTKGADPSLTHRDKFVSQPPAFTLTTAWTKYEIPLTGATYDEVLGGFCWVASATTSGTTTFYIDDVQWLP